MRPIEVALSHIFVFYNAFQVVVFTCVHRKEVEICNCFQCCENVIINKLSKVNRQKGVLLHPRAAAV